MRTQPTQVSCAVATANGFAVPYSCSSTSDGKGYMEKHPEFEVVRTSLLSKLMIFVSGAPRSRVGLRRAHS